MKFTSAFNLATHFAVYVSILKSVLQDVPDYAQRRRRLEGLKNRLEALLSPKIVAAFNNHSLGKSFFVTEKCELSF